MVVAKCARAFLDIGFLKKDGVGPLSVAGVDVEAAFFEEASLVLFDAILAKTITEFAEEFLVADDEAGVEEGGAGLRFVFCLCDAIGN